ncbi:hypothetical protein ABE021_13560 [Sporosarcina gallistercoris]
MTGRQEIIPDWFKEKDDGIESNEKESDAEVENKRQGLLKKLEDLRRK